MCRRLNLFAHAVASIDGSKFKAVNARDKNFTKASIQRRMEQVEASIERYMAGDCQNFCVRQFSVMPARNAL